MTAARQQPTLQCNTPSNTNQPTALPAQQHTNKHTKHADKQLEAPAHHKHNSKPPLVVVCYSHSTAAAAATASPVTIFEAVT